MCAQKLCRFKSDPSLHFLPLLNEQIIVSSSGRTIRMAINGFLSQRIPTRGLETEAGGWWGDDSCVKQHPG